jgi:hypothetical protein
MAPGSDNWAVTWANDGHQYTTWGDGGGFGGDNKIGRVSLGIARIEGDFDSFLGINIWGGANALTPATFAGKSYGLLSINSELWMWRTGGASDGSAYREQSLYFSNDKGKSWQTTNVKFTQNSFRGKGFFAPTFLQFGAGYTDRRDDFVYMYAPEIRDEEWEVQKPGSISLFRAPIDALSNKDSYEFYSGKDEADNPLWTKNVNERIDVLSHPAGVMRTSAIWNKGLNRYFLVTQMVSRFKKSGGSIGVFESCEPWGPWRTVLLENAWEVGLQKGSKTVFWNFSNKWTDQDGKHFSLIYTGPGADEFGTIRGRFLIDENFRSCP